MKIGVIDFGAGNLKSIENALNYLQVPFFVSDKPEECKIADKLIFPGVGQAASAMQNIQKSGLDQMLYEYFAQGKPILGICIGCQIIFDQSEEDNTVCLGILPGKVRRFPDHFGLKIPQIGWNPVAQKRQHFLFTDIPDNTSFYFVHSYYPEPTQLQSVIADSEYGLRFAAAVEWKNLLAVQFHPEKSGKFGLKLIDNFIRFSL